MKISKARQAAFDALWRVETEDAYAGNLLASNRHDDLSPEDRGLMQELVLGVLRWRGRLDAEIERLARRPIRKLDAEVVLALRLGLYQLRFLSRIPAHAAINESVNLVKQQQRKSAAPFANAVLRAAQRAPGGEPVRADAERDSIEAAAIETSHPQWLLERWRARFGPAEARELALANNRPSPVAFRFNTRIAPEERTRAALEAMGVEIRPSTIAPGAAVVVAGSLSPLSEPVREGWIYLQDESSQLVAHLAVPTEHRTNRRARALDLCAAPGSKTSLIASLLPPEAMIVAGDLHPHRLRTLRELSGRLRISNIHPVQLDASAELPFADAFDLILVDAPCSGLGTLQPHPEIKWRMNEAKIRELAALQKRLLANAAGRLRPGGLLTYAVCSTEPEEGEEAIEAFRAAHPDFRDMTRERLTEIGVDPAPLLTSGFGARTFPHRCQTEGFFVCTLWKRK
ncbi:MAG: 16S rRNA (cytosine(967)-C(5))-methyltransferase RsmB [Blastocatellia bacterium]|nr:16S rRNA (cytosine(967)-C(5))-methyltransferase RsmB [Blastocatellia bacterium]